MNGLIIVKKFENEKGWFKWRTIRVVKCTEIKLKVNEGQTCDILEANPKIETM